MITQEDLDQMHYSCLGLQHIIDSNERDVKYAMKQNIKLAYVNELIENASEAKRILDRYVKLIESIKLEFYSR